MASMAFGPTWTSTALPALKQAERQETVRQETMLIDSRGESARTNRLVPYLFPCPEDPDEIDPLCLYQACRGVLTELRINIKVYAEQHWVPEDALTAMVTDWLVSKRMGVEPLPATFFIPEKGSASDSGESGRHLMR